MRLEKRLLDLLLHLFLRSFLFSFYDCSWFHFSWDVKIWRTIPYGSFWSHSSFSHSFLRLVCFIFTSIHPPAFGKTGNRRALADWSLLYDNCVCWRTTHLFRRLTDRKERISPWYRLKDEMRHFSIAIRLQISNIFNRSDFWIERGIYELERNCSRYPSVWNLEDQYNRKYSFNLNRYFAEVPTFRNLTLKIVKFSIEVIFSNEL